MAVRSADINVIASAVLKSARGLARDFGEIESLQASPKGTSAFVAKSLAWNGQVLTRELARARPRFGLLSATASTTGADSARWIFDPINGLANFSRGIPHYAISVALQRDGAVVAGAVYDPLRDDFYWAESGIGAYRNDRRLRVSGRRDPRQMLIGTCAKETDQAGDIREREAALARSATSGGAGLRRLGAAALDLAYVAAGRLDGFWATDLNLREFAAGVLLVREAGGYASDLSGAGEPVRDGGILVANDHLHAALGALLHAA